MQARKGDRVVVPAQDGRGPRREAEVLGARRDDGRPPYHVRWVDTGHEALWFPGDDAFVEPAGGTSE